MLRSELDLFRDAERILDAEVANGAFQLCVPEEQLDRPQVAGLLVNLRHLCSLHRVRPISRAIETGAFNLAVDDTSVLPCRYVRLIMKAARKEVLAVLWCGTDQQSRIAARVCSVILNWTGPPVFFCWITVARSCTRPRRIRSRTRSQPLSLLSMARLNKARRRLRCSTWSRTRIAQTLRS